jgi:hypothetical protein
MSLQDLISAGVDIGNKGAVDAALNAPEAVAAAAATNIREEPVPAHEEADDGDAGDEAAPAGEATSGEAAELTPPEPTGEAQANVAQIDANAERIKALEAELEALRPVAAAATESQQKSEARQEREAELASLIEELGDTHILVKRAKRENAAADAREAQDVQQAETTSNAQNTAAHATHVATTPFLKSFYDGNDDEGIAIASAISLRIQNDAKLAGTKAAEPFTKEHYREVEARLLRRFPEAKSKFYKVAAPEQRQTGKVVTLRQVPGGNSPVPGQAKQVDKGSLFQTIMADPNKSIDQILNEQLRAG